MKPLLAILPFASVHLMRMLGNLVVVKLISVYFGPAGLAALGNFMSMIAITTGTAGGGIKNGVTKYVAELRATNPVAMFRMLCSATAIGLTFSFVLFIFTVLFSSRIASFAMQDASMGGFVIAFGACQILTFIAMLAIAVANGYQNHRAFFFIGVTGYAIAMFVAGVLIPLHGMRGAVAALIIGQVSIVLPAVVMILRNPMLRRLRPRARKADLHCLLQFGFIAILSASIYPVAEIAIRETMFTYRGDTETGYWQALTRLSGSYLGFFNVYLASRFMPMISAERDPAGMIKRVKGQIVWAGAVFITIAIGILLLTDSIVVTLFSSEFLPIGQHVPYLLTGDLFRIMGYVIGFVFMAKARIKIYVCCEVTQAIMYVLFPVAALWAGKDIDTIFMLYSLQYILYFLIVLAVYNSIFQKNEHP